MVEPTHMQTLILLMVSATDQAARNAMWQVIQANVRQLLLKEAGAAVVKSITWDAAATMTYRITVNAGIMTTEAYCTRLVTTFGRIAVGEATGTAAAGSTAKTVGSRLLGWPLVVACAALSVGCTYQDNKDMAGANEVAANNYMNWMSRYISWAVRCLMQKEKTIIEAPWTFPEFDLYQSNYKIPR